MTLRPQSVLAAAFGGRSAAGRLGTQQATLTELSDAGCALFTAVSLIDDRVRVANEVVGVALPIDAGKIQFAASRMALWLSPRRWLIRCHVDEEASLVAALNEAFPDKLAHAVPFTDALCWFELAGEAAAELLTEGSFISLERGGLPVGHAKRTLVAQIPAVLIRQSEDIWQVAVERSRAAYFADWLRSAADATEPEQSRCL
jgi:sarcosine oxidase subunit gamma